MSKKLTPMLAGLYMAPAPKDASAPPEPPPAPAPPQVTTDDPAMAHHGTISKVERYGWAALGAKGELMWVRKGDLRVDAEYQRDANDDKILAIAAAFMWPAFGVALVARRADGTLWVFDAQHRLLAALRRSDIEKVPCIVFDIESVGEEAKLFIQANTLRKPLTAIDKHKAAVVSDDPIAVIVEELARETGRRIALDTSPTSLRCVANLRRWIGRDEELVRRMWPLFNRVCEDAPMYERVLDTLFYIESRIHPDRSLTERRWSDRLIARGARGLMRDTADAAALYHKGGAAVWAHGVIEKTLNKGLREELRLSLPGDPTRASDPGAGAT